MEEYILWGIWWIEIDPKRRGEEGNTKTDTKEGCINISNRENCWYIHPWHHGILVMLKK